MMNKFRNVTQEISVNGKLPTDAIMPTLTTAVQEIQYTNIEVSDSYRAKANDFRMNYDELREISIVQSKKSTVKILNDSTLVSTGFLLEVVELLIQMEKNPIALKLLDVISYIVESTSQVFKVSTRNKKIEGTKKDNYRGMRHRYPNAGNRLKFPFLSKRFEATSFLNKAKTLYLDEFKKASETFIEDWTLNLYLYKTMTPKKVLLSETLIVKKLNGGVAK